MGSVNAPPFCKTSRLIRLLRDQTCRKVLSVNSAPTGQEFSIDADYATELLWRRGDLQVQTDVTFLLQVDLLPAGQDGPAERRCSDRRMVAVERYHEVISGPKISELETAPAAGRGGADSPAIDVFIRIDDGNSRTRFRPSRTANYGCAGSISDADRQQTIPDLE